TMTLYAAPSFIEASRLRSTVDVSTGAADYTRRTPGKQLWRKPLGADKLSPDVRPQNLPLRGDRRRNHRPPPARGPRGRGGRDPSGGRQGGRPLPLDDPAGPADARRRARQER